jgi:predicted nuclease of restriction endonuclease-like (RecB) superfamily
LADRSRGCRRATARPTSADYGVRLLSALSEHLTRDFGRGYSVDNLEAFRQLYLEYPQLISETAPRKILPAESAEKSETPSRKSSAAESAPASHWQPGFLHPDLSWSHYRSLLRVGRTDARNFYEIEAIRNAWSVRELSRQIASLLFDRLAKSKDKKGLMELATRGQEVMRPIDVLRDPTVIEFLELPESPRLVESNLEQALISNLQTFLLELGRASHSSPGKSESRWMEITSIYFYIDLVFYHTILKCYVLIELKVGRLTHPISVRFSST